MRRLLWGLIVALPSPALADDKTMVTRTLDAMAECRRIAADAGRLACFDKAVASVEAARTKGDLIVLDRAKVTERRRAQFGLGTGTDAGVGGEAVREIDTTVANAEQTSRYGRWHVQLANGQVWETIDPLRFPPKNGESVTIRAASFGAFRAQFSRQTSQVKRIR